MQRTVRRERRLMKQDVSADPTATSTGSTNELLLNHLTLSADQLHTEKKEILNYC